MPIVQRSARQISTAPLPSARKQFAETARSQGAGVEAAKADRGEAIAGAGGVVARFGAQRFAEVQAEERQRADRVALLEAENRLSAWENERLYHPETGALAVKGKAAFELPEQLAAEYNTLAGEIETSLSTERQRAAFITLRANRGQNLDLTIRRHVFGEMQAHERQELEARVENSVSTAIANANDPKRVGEELSSAVQAIRASAPALGLGPEQLEQRIEKVQSATHVGVIDRLLAQGRDKAAKVYFEETRGQISGEAQARVEKAIAEGTTRAEAQARADQILAEGGTLAQQREKARAIDDAEVRDSVMQRLEHEDAVRERIERDRDEKLLSDAYTILDRTGGNISRIPAGMWSGFTGAERSAMRAYGERVARGVPVETDYATYYGLMDKATTDPAAFAKTNLLTYRAKLDDAEFKELVRLQADVRAGNKKGAETTIGNFRTKTQIIDDSLDQFGVTTGAKATSTDKHIAVQLRRQVDIAVREEAARLGKEPDNVFVQATVDRLLSSQVTKTGRTWYLSPAIQTQRALETTVADIPQAERAEIELALRKVGRQINDAVVLDLYIRKITQPARPDFWK